MKITFDVLLVYSLMSKFVLWIVLDLLTMNKSPTPLDHMPESRNCLLFLSRIAARVRKEERVWETNLTRE